MAKFDVFALSGHRLAVVIQSDILPRLDTTLVIPLIPASQMSGRSPKLYPVFEIDQIPYVLMLTHMAALPTNTLRTRVASLKSEQDAIADAIDTVLYGF